MKKVFLVIFAVLVAVTAFTTEKPQSGQSPELKEVQEYTAICIEHTGPYPGIGAKYAQLMEIVKKHNVKYDTTFGMYYNDPAQVVPEKLRSEACVWINGRKEFKELENEQVIKVSHQPAGKLAVFQHRGGFGKLPASYGKLFGYIKKNNLMITGAAIEFYGKERWEAMMSMPPDKWEWQIAFPVKPSGKACKKSGK